MFNNKKQNIIIPLTVEFDDTVDVSACVVGILPRTFVEVEDRLLILTELVNSKISIRRPRLLSDMDDKALSTYDNMSLSDVDIITV